MDDSTYSMVTDTAEKLFSDQSAAEFDAALWSAAGDAGFPLALLNEDAGGFGFSAREAFAPVRVAAAQAVALPLGETILANWALSLAGLPPLDGSGALAWAGEAVEIPFGRHLGAVVLVSEADSGVALCVLHGDGLQWHHGANHADEPRDTLVLPDPPAAQATIALSPAVLRAAMAMLRAGQMAGAVAAVSDMCQGYCGEREQFGRPLGRFQAIQHQLAVLATHSCAATAAADMAIAAFDTAQTQPETFILAAAAAKIRTAEAATEAASIAHQVHGAIGFSGEYPLHLLTRRLWSWRDENGSETHWAAYLADWVQALPEGGFWPALTACDLTGETA